MESRGSAAVCVNKESRGSKGRRQFAAMRLHKRLVQHRFVLPLLLRPCCHHGLSLHHHPQGFFGVDILVVQGWCLLTQGLYCFVCLSVCLHIIPLISFFQKLHERAKAAERRKKRKTLRQGENISPDANKCESVIQI